MKLLRGAADPALHGGTAAVIGNFDGVHHGHQTLLTAVRALATEANLPLLVIVFEPQTREFFLKDQSPPRLTSLRKKCVLLAFQSKYCTHECRGICPISHLFSAKSEAFVCWE